MYILILTISVLTVWYHWVELYNYVQAWYDYSSCVHYSVMPFTGSFALADKCDVTLLDWCWNCNRNFCLHCTSLFISCINICFADCTFPFQSAVVHIGITQLGCNFSDLTQFLPSVFINGTLQSITEHLHHDDCDIIYVVPISQRHNGLEIAVSYGSSALGRWNATIHICKLWTIVSYCYKNVYIGQHAHYFLSLQPSLM